MVAEEINLYITTEKITIEKLISISDADIVKYDKKYFQQLFLNTDFREGKYDKYFIENSIKEWQVECLTLVFLEKNMSDWMIIRFSDDNFDFLGSRKLTISQKIKYAEIGSKNELIKAINEIQSIQSALEERFSSKINLCDEKYSEYFEKNPIYKWQIKSLGVEHINLSNVAYVKGERKVPDSIIKNIGDDYKLNTKKDFQFYFKKLLVTIGFLEKKKEQE